MLVLDSLEQYLKYEVEPPKTLPFHAEYMKIIQIKKSKLGLILKYSENNTCSYHPKHKEVALTFIVGKTEKMVDGKLPKIRYRPKYSAPS